MPYGWCPGCEIGSIVVFVGAERGERELGGGGTDGEDAVEGAEVGGKSAVVGCGV